MEDLLNAASQRGSSPHTLPGLISQRDAWRAECAAKTQALIEKQFMLSFQRGQFRQVAKEAAALAKRKASKKEEQQRADVRELYEMGYSTQQLISDIEVIQQEILQMTDEKNLEAARYWLPIYLEVLANAQEDESYEKQNPACEASLACSEYYAYCSS
jgi:hypothetical protein